MTHIRGPESLLYQTCLKFSIADFLEIVNTTHQSILPEDVLGHLGETRNPEGEYTDQVKFSLKGTETDSDAAAVMAENAALRKMVDIAFKDVEGVPAYEFDFPVMLISLAVFILVYEILMFVYSERIKKISVKEIMME